MSFVLLNNRIVDTSEYQIHTKNYIEKELGDGSLIKGNIKNGNGRGTRIFRNHNIWQGEFKRYKLEGSGMKILLISHQILIIKGNFKNGLLDGEGKIINFKRMETLQHGIYRKGQLRMKIHGILRLEKALRLINDNK